MAGKIGKQELSPDLSEVLFSANLTDVAMSDTNLILTFDDSSTENWSLIKNSNGDITQIKNNNDGKIINISTI